ncbi:hypothetical protein ACH5RR_017947 [Cinchona calisaya]|uniref:Uncharacterized protein n=1 Tax=Cinchona calisaya TaxID=153742 RepID=A0ABD2ZQ31_9GENT
MTESSLCTKKLEGKIAIITGGASGIGEATARLFANRGAKVVIADVQDEKGQKLAESIGSNICSYLHCNVTQEDQVKTVIDWTLHTYGQVDIMFSNAGKLRKYDQDGQILDLELSTVDELLAINARGMAACVKHVARAMVERGVKGSIVCTGSTAAISGRVGWTGYHMSKHAVLGLMRCAINHVAEAVLFLVSDDSAFITGHNVMVDGGRFV